MKKILVVDDIKEIRDEISDILRMEHFDVYNATNGVDGLKATNKVSPNLIITDITMPLLDGYEFLTELKRNKRTENIPVILISAKSELFDIRKGMNIGADDYLPKPFSAEDLITAVNNKLQSRVKLEDKLNSVKTQVIKYLPHELLTPLNGVLGLSEYMKDHMSTGNDEIYKVANSINFCGQRLHHLIENYLYYTNLVAELHPTIKDSVDFEISTIETSDIVDLNIFFYAENRFYDLLFNIEFAEIKFNKVHFTKIVKELIANAVKFSNPGNKIHIFSKIVGKKYILKVENYGTGISQEQVDEIGAFVQFDRKEKEQQGLGLGLEIVKLITEFYNGDIEINSQKDKYFKVSVKFDI